MSPHPARHRAPFFSPARIGRRLRRPVAVGAALALLAPVAIGTAAAAAAPTAVLNVAKTASVAEVGPGESLVWEIQLGCESLEDICVDAEIADTIPAPFELKSVKVVGTENPAGVETEGNELRVAFAETDERFPGVAGLGDGQRVSVLVTATLPASTPVTADGIPVTNTVEAVAANAARVTASSTVTPRIAPTVAVGVTKSWASPSQLVGAGTENTVTLGVRNASNIPVDALELADPAEGTANPFEQVAFARFDGLSFPEGADRVAVTAITASGPVAGAPSSELTLPAGVAPADVLGLSFAFSAADGTLPADGAAGSVRLVVQQRAGLPTSGTTVENTAAARAVAGERSATDTARASFVIQPLAVTVEAGKRFEPREVLAGEGSRVTVSARNTSNHALDALSIVEPAPGTTGLAANGLAFAGFGAAGDGDVPAGQWPEGATEATVTIRYADGGGAPVGLARGDVWPAADAGREVVGFRVDFAGEIPPGATGSIPFLVDTDDATPAQLRNVVQALGSSEAGEAEPATSAARLDVTPKGVGTRVTKRLTPGEIAGVAGQKLVATLTGDVRDSNAPVRELVIEDQANSEGGSDLWGVFRAERLTATAVPAHSELRVLAWDGSAWNQVGAPVEGPATAEVALPADAQGVRLVFSSTREEGFTNGYFIRARILFELTESQPIGAEFANCAVSAVAGDNALTADDGPACATAVVVRGDGGPVPLLDVDSYKTWRGSELWIPVDGTLPSTRLDLEVANRTPLPVETLALDEPSRGTDPFELLDLTRIESVALPAGADPAATSIRLERADGSVVFERTGADAIAAARALDAGALAEVTRIRISSSGVLDEDQQLKATLATQLRETTRSGGEPVLAALEAADPPYSIDNTVTGTVADGPERLTADSSARLIVRPLDQQPLAAQLTKSFGREQGTLYSPDPAASLLPVELRIERLEGAPTSYLVEDTAATFWNAVDFRGVRSVHGAHGPDDLTARIDYLTGGEFALDEDGAPVVSGGSWRPGAEFAVPAGGGDLPAAARELPAGVAQEDVQGIRILFAATEGRTIPSGFSHDGTSGQRLVFDVALRPELRTGGPVTDRGAEEPLPGETLPGHVTDVATATASNPARTVEVPEDDAVYRIVPGTTAFEIAKTPDTSQLVPGEEQRFQLSVANTGTTPLVNPVLADRIPQDAQGPLLAYDPVRGTPASFAVTPASAAIPVDPELVAVEVAEDGSSVEVSFPEGTTLLPGERYTVTLPMTVRPGVAPGTELVNEFEFTADGGIRATDDARIRVLEGGAYQRIKDVREIVAPGDERSGMLNTLDGSASCIEDEGFTRVPCLVKTRPGGEEEWRLRVTNTGNLPTTELTIVDVLPHPGDTGTSRSLSGLSRGSTWAPSYLGGLELGELPEGASWELWHQTADDERCAFTGDPASADPWGEGCADAQWHAGEPADPATVTAIKVVFSFPTALEPGDGVELRYRTRTPVTLPEEAPAIAAPAWNSMVVTTATDAGDRIDWETLEPNKAGIAFELPDYRVAVGDVVWVDSDGDGVQGPGEPALPGVTVTLLTAHGEQVGEPVVTDEHGRYLFDELPVGEYRLEFALTEEQRSRFAFTARGAGEDAAADSDADPATGRTALIRLDRPAAGLPNVVDAAAYPDQPVAAAYIDPTVDAGVVPFRVSVGDLVWFDADGDGLQDADEPGIPGVVLTLEGPDGGVVTDVHGREVGPVTTDADGRYEFVELPVLAAGQHYTVRVDVVASGVALGGMVPTVPGAGEDRAIDSSSEFAESRELVLDGDRDETLDFGFVFAELPTLPLDPPGLALTGLGPVLAALLAAALLVLAGALSVLIRRRLQAHG